VLEQNAVRVLPGLERMALQVGARLTSVELEMAWVKPPPTRFGAVVMLHQVEQVGCRPGRIFLLRGLMLEASRG